MPSPFCLSLDNLPVFVSSWTKVILVHDAILLGQVHTCGGQRPHIIPFL